MTTAEFAGVWKAWNVLLDGEVDANTKNLNRLHYLPATWHDEDGVFGNNEYHVQDGQIMDVDELLMICPPEEPTVLYGGLSDRWRATARWHRDHHRSHDPEAHDSWSGRWTVLQAVVCRRYHAQGKRVGVEQ